MDQILYYTGMKYTTATFAIAMCNVLPALTFVMAWIFRYNTISISVQVKLSQQCVIKVPMFNL